MKQPVEQVRISSKEREILIKIKRKTGLEHWNEICRIALFVSLANPTKPSIIEKKGESAIEIEWKTFAGKYQDEIAALTIIRAKGDGINISSKNAISEYFMSHVGRGIVSLQNYNIISSLLGEK